MSESSLPPGAREAAEAHAKSRYYPSGEVALRPVDEYSLQQLRECSAEDFLAGVEWALSPPTPEEIEAAIQAHRGTHDHEMRTALLAFLEGRKGV